MQNSVSYNNDSRNGNEIISKRSATQNPFRNEESHDIAKQYDTKGPQNPYRNEKSHDMAKQYETKGPKNMLPNHF